MELIGFWILWALTLVLCASAVLRAWWNPRDALGLPLFASAVWSYFYVYMAYQAVVNLRDQIPLWTLPLAQGLAFVSLAALQWGWSLGVKADRTGFVSENWRGYRWNSIWWAGLVLMGAGTLGHRAFQSNVPVDYASSSAYWYMLFQLGYPGLGLALSAWLFSSRRSKIALVVLLSLALLHMSWFIANARRSPMFPSAVILTVLPAFLCRRIPRPSLIIGTLVGLGLVMMAFVEVRTYIYNGLSWREATQTLDFDNVVVKRTVTLGDNEFVYHCWLIGSAYDGALYQYGTGHLSLLAHWIPRYFWPSKPRLGEGIFPSAYENIPDVAGEMPTNGASAAGVATTFVEYSFLAPIFWLLIGRVSAWLFTRFEAGDSLPHAYAYVGVLSTTLLLIAQGFDAAFVPGAIYVLVPLFVLKCFRRSSSAEPRCTIGPADMTSLCADSHFPQFSVSG